MPMEIDAGETRPSAQPPALLLGGKFPAIGEGKEVGPRAEPHKPQRLRCAVRRSLAFLPAAADTFLPTRPRGPCPPQRGCPASMASRLMSDPFVCLSVCQCGPPTPSPGLSLPCLWPPVLSTVGSAHKAQQGGVRGAAGEECPPPPTRPRDHTPPTLPFPHSCLRSQLPAHQLLTRGSLLVTSQQGTAAGL